MSMLRGYNIFLGFDKPRCSRTYGVRNLVFVQTKNLNLTSLTVTLTPNPNS